MLKDHAHTVVPGVGQKLNLGCGFDYREGYINVDMNPSHKVDLISDVTWLRAIPDGSCAEIVAQDVLEHIQRLRGGTALREWNRVLQEGGRLTLRVPSLVHLLGLISNPARQSLKEQRTLIQCLYGTQGYEGDFHFNGFTEVTLRGDLSEAGFKIADLKIMDEWLFDVIAVKVSNIAPDSILRVDSDAEFIDAVYRTLLGRELDEEGRAYYLRILASGIVREAVIKTVKASDEFRSRRQ